MSIPLLLRVLALVFLALAAANVPGRVSWGWLGMLLWVLSGMVP